MRGEVEIRLEAEGASRRRGGDWLMGLRETAGLSQRQLAGQVGESFAAIARLEAGGGDDIPPCEYRAWADALGVTSKAFVREVMRYYEPATFGILFGGPQQPASNDNRISKSASGRL
jgi:transcriptional regulator with XRE-family HTH domain